MTAAPDMLILFGDEPQTSPRRARSITSPRAKRTRGATPATAQPPMPTSEADRDARRHRDQARLEPVVLALAKKVAVSGFTVDNVRRAAVSAGIITGHEASAGRQRALSWLGPFLTSMCRRELIAPLTYPDGQKVRRASDRPEANGNKSVVYVLPEFARVIGAPKA